MNRKVILYIATSLDGYIADGNGAIEWLTEYGDSEALAQEASYQNLYQRIDTVIMGRKTYDQVVNELMPEMDSEYFYKDKKSYVMTHRDGVAEEGVTFSSEPISFLVEKLLEKPGQDIWIIGGASLVNELVEADLIDEYQITLIPILLGEGIPLFTPKQQRTTLTLQSSMDLGGLVYLTYTR